MKNNTYNTLKNNKTILRPKSQSLQQNDCFTYFDEEITMGLEEECISLKDIYGIDIS